MMKKIPVYKHPASYAKEHDELAAYRASNQANTACKEAIETAIRDHYRDNRLDTAAVDQVVQQFGYDRTFHVLAITVCQADWDRRYSPDNRAWANAMSIPANPDASLPPASTKRRTAIKPTIFPAATGFGVHPPFSAFWRTNATPACM